MTLRAIRKNAENAVAELEVRKRHLAEQRRPIPHALAQHLKAARRHALAVGRRAR